MSGEDYCCAAGCGGGGCETCPCCCAGWCIGFRDGDPRTWIPEQLIDTSTAVWNFDWWAFLCLDERGFAAVDPGPMP